jgi:membrane protein implicated in regulation of membrane protease activity
VKYPSRTAAAFFATTAVIAAAEAILTGLYLPWPALSITFGAAACLLAWLAAAERTALRRRRHVATPVATGHGGRRSAARS